MNYSMVYKSMTFKGKLKKKKTQIEQEHCEGNLMILNNRKALDKWTYPVQN